MDIDGYYHLVPETISEHIPEWRLPSIMKEGDGQTNNATYHSVSYTHLTLPTILLV